MTEKNIIKNPVIPGFYPDPSIVRVGEDYYLVNSSFELFPGIPIFHSRDLANWEQIGNVMTMDNAFHVFADAGSGGVMAPTIRYHDGTFYIVNCNFADKGNFYVYAKDPAGPWSEPVWITDIPDIDCSLFFDNDGSCYLVSPGNDESEDNGRAMFLTPYDIEKGCVRGERKKIWNSALRKAWAPEAPHIYHIGEWYYLLIAEGGTEHFHSVTIARSKTVDGWYEGFRGNPIMTHRHLGLHAPIANVGHADFVDTPSGDWYAVMLGSRLIDGQYRNLGRETYLCPMIWEDGWPVLSPGTGKVEFTYPADEKLPWTPVKGEPERDDFDSEALGQHLVFWGTPYQDFWKIENSCLILKCLKRPMVRKLTGFFEKENSYARDDCLSFLGRRQREINFDVSLKMTFAPEGDEAAGLAVVQAANHQLRFEAAKSEGRRVLRLVLVTTKQEGLPFLPGYKAETSSRILKEADAPEGPICMKLEARGEHYTYYAGPSEDALQLFLDDVDAGLINPEDVGGMIGTMLGMFATANEAESDNAAAFDYFELKNL